MKKVMLLSLIAILCAAGGLQAAVVTWGPMPPSIANQCYDAVDETAWVLQDGQLVVAINGSDAAPATVNYAGIDWINADQTEMLAGVTANGVTITASQPDGTTALSFTTAFGTGAFTVNTDAFYSGGLYSLGRITMTGLSPGMTYALQIMGNDGRGTGTETASRWTVLGDGTQSVADSITAGTEGAIQLRTTPVGYASYMLGTFTADSDTQVIECYGDSGGWYTDLNRLSTSQFNALQLRQLGGERGKAHSPAPTGTDVDRLILDPDNPGQISWKAPLTSSDPNGDPNLLSVTKFDITYYIVNNPPAEDDPNLSEYGTTYPNVTSPYTPASMDFDQTMFWRVDTTVVWDSNELLDPNTYTDNGNGTYTQLVVGSDWQFSTAPYYPPIITFNGVITSVDIDADLSATITETSYLIDSDLTEFELLDDDSEFPTGSDATLIGIDTTTEPNNPTATLTTTYPGIYKVKLTVSDGTSTGEVEAIARVTVSADACEAAKAAGIWTQNYYDVTGIYLDPNEPDCLVDVLDFDSLAFDWLDDTTMTEPGPYTGAVTYAPKDVYNDLTKRIEAEAYFDVGVCSDPPITDTTGIRITNDPNSGASGDEYSSYASANAFIGYYVNVPVAAVDEPVDVYIGYAKNTGTGNFSFGSATVSDLYGTTLDLPATGSWIEFVGAYAGQVTFDASGLKLVYMTYSTGMNVDWFAFDWPEE